MRVRIRMASGGGCRTDIDVDAASVTIGMGRRGVSIRVDADGSDAALRFGGYRDTLERYYKNFGKARGVSPEMETAAVRAFLADADLDRLGRSLAVVYEAMEAVRRSQTDDGDD